MYFNYLTVAAPHKYTVNLLQDFFLLLDLKPEYKKKIKFGFLNNQVALYDCNSSFYCRINSENRVMRVMRVYKRKR